MTTTLYTRPNCGACFGTKKQFENLGIEFEEIDVSQNPDIAQHLVDEGWRAMPVIKSPVGDWSGMSMAKIKELAAA